jgi:ADP-ribose pyrophosphatase YjhB (NUDIX family)
MTNRRRSGRLTPLTRRDEAAGGAVIDLDGPTLQLVLIATPHDGIVRWSLPKGHPKDSETREQTATREVREETGLEVEIIEPLGTIDYWFTDTRFRYHKFVYFYLMRAVGGDLSHHDDEVVEAGRFTWDDALRRMAYASERKLVGEARDRALSLLSNPRTGQ